MCVVVIEEIEGSGAPALTWTAARVGRVVANATCAGV